ncbi:hypothetical protein VQ643_12835 [Pseudomonas sp. F1_0610]|uniref:hypothetical protein n=1 Tax=Pseudomonas sp. F1_0610 TaxID=3114284 RepID=UPI0039C4D936
MTQHDFSQAPLIITVEQGEPTLTQLQQFIQDWGKWLQSGESFATLRIFSDAESLIHPEGSGPIVKRWFQASSQAIRTNVLGMANVVPASEYTRMSKMNAEKLFGVPAATFADIPSALAWLKERVLGNKLDVAQTLEVLERMQVNNDG